MDKSAVVRQAKTASFLPPVKGILQRKCACGNSTVASEECAECTKKKSGLQRKHTLTHGAQQSATNGMSADQWDSSAIPLDSGAPSLSRCIPQAQAKFVVSMPGNRYEREADRIAEAIVSGSKASPGRTSNTEVPMPQRMERTLGSVSDSGVADRAAHELGNGRPLDAVNCADFGRRLGHDLSHVRLHTDAAAAKSAAAFGARAYTMGRNIVFGTGEYAPGASSGRHLLAHELVHVVQQGAAPRMKAISMAPAAYSLRIIDEQGGEKFIGPPIPDDSDISAPKAGAQGQAAVVANTVPQEDAAENIPVQRTPRDGATPTVFIQRTASFTKPVPIAEDPLMRIIKGLTPGLTTPDINGTKSPTGDQLLTMLTTMNVKQTGSKGGKVSCQADNFNIGTTAEQIVPTSAPAGGWTATIKPASAISSEAKCAKVAQLPITMNAQPSNAGFVKLVQKSEDEHVTDLKWLHDRYLIPYDAFVNSLSGSGKDLPACGQDLVGKLGFRHLETAYEFGKGWATSLQKFDGPLGTHNDTAKISTNKDCSAATLTVNRPAALKAGAGPGNVAVIKPTVMAFNPAKLKVVGNDIKENKTVVKRFSNAADAKAALALIQHYGMNSRNVIGSLEYFLVSGAAPSGAFKGANELVIDPNSYQVTFDFPNAGEWAITDISAVASGVNVNVIASFGANRDEAYTAWSILQAFRFTRQGWVGGTRQKPKMSYFRL